MAKPAIHYATGGSNTAASGCPFGMTAVTGALASGTGAGTTIALGATVDLTGAAAGDAIWIEGSAATDRHLFEISSFTGGVGTCTAVIVVEAITNTFAAKLWAVGGKRLNAEYNATRYDVLDGSDGWVFWFEGTTTFDSSIRWIPDAGAATYGGITIRGDSATTRATLRMTGNNAHMDNSTWLKIWNLIFTTNNGTNNATGAIRGISNNGRSMEMRDCKISGLFNGFLFDSAYGVYISNCEITGCVGSGVRSTTAANGVTFTGCYIHGNNTGDGAAAGGVEITGGTGGNIITLVNCVVSDNKRANINWDGAGTVAINGSVIYGALATTGNGINISAIGTNGSLSVLSTIIYGNAGYGIGGITSAVVSAILNNGCDFNAFGNNSSGALQYIAAGANDVTLSGDPFTNAAGGDYSLDASGLSEAGSLGFPKTLPGGATTTNICIGLAQRAAAAGGGAAVLVNGGVVQ